MKSYLSSKLEPKHVCVLQDKQQHSCWQLRCYSREFPRVRMSLQNQGQCEAPGILHALLFLFEERSPPHETLTDLTRPSHGSIWHSSPKRKTAHPIMRPVRVNALAALDLGKAHTKLNTAGWPRPASMRVTSALAYARLPSRHTRPKGLKEEAVTLHLRASSPFPHS